MSLPATYNPEATLALQVVPRRGGLRSQGLVEIIGMLLELHSDPVGRNLAGFIDEAVAAAVDSIGNKDWLKHFPSLAAMASTVGPSHR